MPRNDQLQFWKTCPFSILLILANIFIFACYAFQGISTILLLELGANFAPFTLDQEPQRLISSMFLHGNLLHLIANVYSLWYLGSKIEPEFGSITFLKVYFFTGIAAGLASAFFNLFMVSVGASGAIFGLYGYYLVYHLSDSQQKNHAHIIANFVLYLVVMFFLGRQLNFDNAAHFGGVVAGLLLGLLELLTRTNKSSWALILLLFPAYMLLPRFQVAYFQAYQYLIRNDRKIITTFNAGLDDHEFLKELLAIEALPDSTRIRFAGIGYLPPDLHADTATLNRYLSLREEQINYFIKGLSRESYIFLDSVQHAGRKIGELPPPMYHLNFGPGPHKSDSLQNQPDSLVFAREFYDEDWLKTAEDQASYYRMGQKDRTGEWHGPIEDYYASGAIQMKGYFHQGLRHGIFIFYNEDSTYSSAGRFYLDNPVGKWEAYYNNGKLANEARYEEGTAYLENSWDSLGNPMLVNRQGVEEFLYPNAVVRYKRPVRDGLNHGFCEGYYENGDLRFKEYYEKGELIRGIAYEEDGSTHTYDISTLWPFPEGGFEHFYKLMEERNSLSSDTVRGEVHLRFNVHPTGKIQNVRLLKRMGSPYDEYARELLLNGPEWIPARAQGHLPMHAIAEVFIAF